MARRVFFSDFSFLRGPDGPPELVEAARTVAGAERSGGNEAGTSRATDQSVEPMGNRPWCRLSEPLPLQSVRSHEEAAHEPVVTHRPGLGSIGTLQKVKAAIPFVPRRSVSGVQDLSLRYVIRRNEPAPVSLRVRIFPFTEPDAIFPFSSSR